MPPWQLHLLSGAHHLDRTFAHLLERLDLPTVIADDLQPFDPASRMKLVSALADRLHERTLSRARLGELYHRSGRHDEIDGALSRALDLAAAGHEVVPRTRTVINALRYGSAALNDRAEALLADLDLANLQHDMRHELAELLAERSCS
jgi:uncharacterized membrane protein YccC